MPFVTEFYGFALGQIDSIQFNSICPWIFKAWTHHLPSVDEDAVVGTVAHEVCVHDVVLDHPPAYNDSSRVLCLFRV
jgi:hypothetical protein